MSKENLVELIDAVAADQDLQQQWQELSSYAMVKDLAAGQGLDLGDLGEADAKRIVKMAMRAGAEELLPAELDLVTGGAYDLNPNDLSLKLGGDGKSRISGWLGKDSGGKDSTDSVIFPIPV
jgi:hypothetical protein